MKPGRTLFFTALGMFGLYSVEFGVVGILPAIVDRYHVSVAQAGWLVALFALVVAALGPFIVVLLGRFDRRRLLIGALTVFTVCSALSALAPNFWVLMALRVPSALLHPVFFSAALATAVSLYPPERATHATSMAFVGTSMGMVLGVPLTTWIAARISYEASFYFCATVNGLAALGLLLMLGPSPTAKASNHQRQLAILRKPAVWLAIAMTICVFGAGFSVYSYAAAYLAKQTGLSRETIGALLVVFGVGGLLGNLAAGRLLARFRIATVLAYPLSLALAYLVLLTFGSPSLMVMVPICLVWGATHTAGLMISQTWMTSAAPDAREFATSLYLSSANVGVLVGAAVGGLAITMFGMVGALWSGWLFAAATLAFIAIRVWGLDERVALLAPGVASGLPGE